MGLFKNWINRVLSARKIKRYDSENLKGYLVDTNILLGMPEILEQYRDKNPFIPSHTLREIEHLELVRKQDKVLQSQIRKFKRLSKGFDNYVDLKDYKFNMRKDWDKGYTDNVLIQICLEENLGLITNDILLRKKARLYKIPVIEPEVGSYTEHKGFKEVFMLENELTELYQNLDKNEYDLLVNEYLIVYDDISGELVDILKWNGQMLQSLQDKKGRLNNGFRTDQFGEFKPKDEYQIIALDSAMNNQITSLRGGAGSGKSLISLNVAWYFVEKFGYKLYIFVNPVPSLNAQELGFYTGDRLGKLMQSSIGNMLKAKFGDEIEILTQIQDGKMDILPFVDLRGFDTGDKAIIWIVEAQNLTSELLKLGLQRVGEGSKVLIDGDYHQQIDKQVYEFDSGMQSLSEVFRGDELYGEVELQNVHRSRIAELAEKM